MSRRSDLTAGRPAACSSAGPRAGRGRGRADARGDSNREAQRPVDAGSRPAQTGRDLVRVVRRQDRAEDAPSRSTTRSNSGSRPDEDDRFSAAEWWTFSPRSGLVVWSNQDRHFAILENDEPPGIREVDACSPDRIRTGATALRGRRPGPLDDGAPETSGGSRQLLGTALGYQDSNLD
jgi:hypothetical protein